MVSPPAAQGFSVHDRGYVDLHTHLVPGVDDGAESQRDAETLLQNAAAAGTSVLVVTPHVYPGVGEWREIDALMATRDRWVEAANRDFPDICVLAGAEVHCTHELTGAFQRFSRRLTLNGGDYFLLEFPFDVLFPGIDELIFHLQRDGWIPIIAHPERNEVIQRSPAVLYRMVRAGALVQVNAGSLEGRFGQAAQRCAVELLRHHLVHAVASDAHWPGERPADLSNTAELLIKSDLGDPDVLMRRNPLSILRNQGLERMPDPRDPGDGGDGIISRLVRRFRAGTS